MEPPPLGFRLHLFGAPYARTEPEAQSKVFSRNSLWSSSVSMRVSRVARTIGVSTRDPETYSLGMDSVPLSHTLHVLEMYVSWHSHRRNRAASPAAILPRR